MKTLKYIALALSGILLISSCEKKDYPAGTPEYDHHYYLAYLPNTNAAVSVTRNQAALIKFPVQFYSAFVRSYSPVTYYAVITDGITNPAIRGQDFNIVDKDGNVLQPTDGRFAMTFPQAIKKVDTIYVKLLNSTVPGTRKMEVQIQTNMTPEYAVDNFSTAFRRPVEIK